jgi:Flp pilus assembly protein TadD
VFSSTNVLVTWTESQTDFDRKVRSNPDDGRTYYFRSLLLRKSGDGNGADEDLQKALDLVGQEARKR